MGEYLKIKCNEHLIGKKARFKNNECLDTSNL